MGLLESKDLHSTILQHFVIVDLTEIQLTSKKVFDCVNSYFYSITGSHLSVSCWVRSNCLYRWNPSSVECGRLLRNRTLFVGGALVKLPLIDYDRVPWYTPITSNELQSTELEGGRANAPCGWSTTRAHQCLDPKQSRYYWELVLLWTQDTGDIIVGLVDSHEETSAKNGQSWGGWYHCYISEFAVFKNHRGSWNFGGGGPHSSPLTKATKAPFVLSVLVDISCGTLHYLIDGKSVGGINCDWQPDKLFLFVTTYGVASSAQILHQWRYPEIAHSWLFNKSDLLQFQQHPNRL